MPRTRRGTSISTDPDLLKLIGDIHSRLDSPIFNGGFDALVQNVQNIEKELKELNEKNESLHGVVYEPDNGLFARVKRVETTAREELEPLRRDVGELTVWKAQMESKDGPLAQQAADRQKIDEVIKLKKNFMRFFLGGGVITLLMAVKQLWEFFSTHVSLH